jgi:hypothetical protein
MTENYEGRTVVYVVKFQLEQPRHTTVGFEIAEELLCSLKKYRLSTGRNNL